MVLGLRSKIKENSDRLRERANRASLAIDHRIQVLRTKIRQPRQMQMIEKVTFLFGVVSVLLIQQLMLLAPHHIISLFVWTLIPLMAIRYVDFHRQKWHYFLVDFCYYTNAMLFYYLIWAPTESWLFKVLFVWSNGPLMWAIVMWRSGLVFHSLPHITTIYIHILPALVTYVIRWLPSNQLVSSSLCLENDCSMSWTDVYAWPIILYLLWQGLYLLKTEWWDREKLQADSDIGTSLRHLIIFYKDHPFGKFAQSLGPQYVTAMFVIMQLVYTGIVAIPTYLFFQYKWAHLIFILFISIISVWNGAGYYIFKLSKNTDATSLPGSPNLSENWYQRYIRRGQAGVTATKSSRRNSVAAFRGKTIDSLRESGTDSEAGSEGKKKESKKRK